MKSPEPLLRTTGWPVSIYWWVIARAGQFNAVCHRRKHEDTCLSWNSPGNFEMMSRWIRSHVIWLILVLLTLGVSTPSVAPRPPKATVLVIIVGRTSPLAMYPPPRSNRYFAEAGRW